MRLLTMGMPTPSRRPAGHQLTKWSVPIGPGKPADFITAADPECRQRTRRNMTASSRTSELIASRTWKQPAVPAAAGTVLTNKYAEGYPWNAVSRRPPA